MKSLSRFSFVAVFAAALAGCDRISTPPKTSADAPSPNPTPSKSPADAPSLKSFLPQPPSGWVFQKEPQEERVVDAGTRAWAVYRPATAGPLGRVELYLLLRSDLKKGETFDSVFQSGAFSKLMPPRDDTSRVFFFQVITTNLAAVVRLFGGENTTGPQTEEEEKQLISLFWTKGSQNESNLVKAFPRESSKR
jgi:hypothetical protein